MKLLQILTFFISPTRIFNRLKRDFNKLTLFKSTNKDKQELANQINFLHTSEKNHALLIRLDYSSFEKSILIDNNLKLLSENTMVSYPSLVYAYNLTLHIIKNKISGDIVETGCWKGGSAAVIYFALKKLKSNKKIYLYDSFMGLPNLTKHDLDDQSSFFDSKTLKKEWKVNDEEFTGMMRPLESEALKSDIDEIKNFFFNTLKAKKNQIIINKGWFVDSFQNSYTKKIKKISLLRLDADLYESTKISLETFYERVERGGVIIIDDYSLPGCKKACSEFFKKNKIKPLLIPIDSISAFFIKM